MLLIYIYIVVLKIALLVAPLTGYFFCFQSVPASCTIDGRDASVRAGSASVAVVVVVVVVVVAFFHHLLISSPEKKPT